MDVCILKEWEPIGSFTEASLESLLESANGLRERHPSARQYFTNLPKEEGDSRKGRFVTRSKDIHLALGQIAENEDNLRTLANVLWDFSRLHQEFVLLVNGEEHERGWAVQVTANEEMVTYRLSRD